MNFLNQRESSFPFVKEDSRDSIATAGYDPLESTGLEWNYGLVDEFIYEEYGDKEVTNAGYTIIQSSTKFNQCFQTHFCQRALAMPLRKLKIQE